MRFLTNHGSGNIVAGVLAGVCGGLTHAAVNTLDQRLLGYRTDDLLVHGGLLSDVPKVARRIGLAAHLTASAAFGAVFATACAPTTAQESLQRGVALAMVEHVGLYPLAAAMDRLHPYILDGRMDPFFSLDGFAQATVRHLALGLVMGASYPLCERLIASVAPDVRYA